MASPKFVAKIEIPNRRLFDSVWPKDWPNLAQDDTFLCCEFQAQDTREKASGAGNWYGNLIRRGVLPHLFLRTESILL